MCATRHYIRNTILVIMRMRNALISHAVRVKFGTALPNPAESAIFPINAHLAYAMKRVDCLHLENSNLDTNITSNAWLITTILALLGRVLSHLK